MKPRKRDGRYLAKDVHRELLALERQQRHLGGPHAAFIQVRKSDFASCGLSQVVPTGDRAGGLHFLSTVEGNAHLNVLRYGKAVEEQYGMSLDDDGCPQWDPPGLSDQRFPGAAGTVTIAQSLGLKHPIRSDRNPRVLTTDLLVLDNERPECALFIRPASDIPARGTREFELFDIARAYWACRSLRLYICTDQDIPPPVLQTWAWDSYQFYQQPGDSFMAYMAKQDPALPLTRVLKHWPAGAVDGLRRFKSGVINGWIDVSLTRRCMPTVDSPWPWRTLTRGERESSWRRFLHSLEVRNG